MGISLSPATACNLVGNNHTVTATVTDQLGNPVANILVYFTVTGANPTSGTKTTGANGKADFTYPGNNIGTDTISAYFIDPAGNHHNAQNVTKGWVKPVILCPDKYDWSKTTAHPLGYQWSANKKTFTAWNIVRFVNKGTGNAKNVKATIVCWPLNVTPIDKTVFLGDIPAGGSAWSNFVGSTDPDFCLATDMTNPQDPKKGILWDVEYDDICGHHVIKNVPKFCGEPTTNCP